MTPSSDMKPLSQRKRQLIFIMSVLLFATAVPASVFYAIGYRFDFTGDLKSIKTVGGMYVRNDTPNTEMRIDEEPVNDMRVFQKAAYIQNLEAGMHRIHVQGKQVQTWVKKLPVYAYLVTEVSSFNMPTVPQIRLITQWNDEQTGKGIEFDSATSTQLAFASTTNSLQFSTTTATTTFVRNSEYVYIKSLFASSTELKAELSSPVKKNPKRQFSFDVATSSAKEVRATTTKSWRNFKLFERGSGIYIAWEGSIEDIPYYYCIEYEDKLQTISQYGQHVYDALVAQTGSSTVALQDMSNQRVCRTEIHIDDLRQKVTWFDYFPNSTDHVLMHLQDGLYVVEVDDRSWQNTQPLYPGKNIEVLQDGGRIFVHDGEYFLEVFTSISSQS